MSKHNFSFVTALLLLLLIAAIMNLLFIYHAFNEDSAPASPGGAPVLARQSSVPGSEPRSAPPSGSPVSFAPSWRGDAVMVKSPQGGYDLVVEALGNGGDALPSTAAEVDIRRPGAAAAEQSPSLEMVSVGKFVAHVDLPESGTWEVRIRIHRGLQTLEFAEKFDLK